jgi:hypothetical protein
MAASLNLKKKPVGGFKLKLVRHSTVDTIDSLYEREA